MAEAVVLLAISSLARIFLTFPRALVEVSGPASWMSAASGLILAIFQIYILYLLLKQSPGKNIVEITSENLGKYAGIAVNLIYAAFFLLVAAFFTRTFSEALILSALPQTPISVISTGYILMAVLGAYIGIEGMARSARVTYPFIISGLLLLLLALLPKWDFSKIFPILGNGPYMVFIEGSFIAGAVTEILLASVIVNYIHGPEMFRKITLRAMLISFSFLVLTMLVFILTFGWTTAQEHTLPFYHLSRLIYLGRFFQRVESVFIIIWGYVGFVKVALTLYAGALTIANTLKLPDHRPLVWPLALVVFVVSLLPPDFTTTAKIEAVFIRYAAWVSTVLLPLLVLAVYKLRSRGDQPEGG